MGYLNVSVVSLTSGRLMKVMSYDAAAGGYGIRAFCRDRAGPRNLVTGACSCSCPSCFSYNIKGPASLVIWATMAAGRAEKLVALA